MFARHHDVAVGSATIHVAEAGDAAGAPIVLLHGNPDTHAVWTDVVARLPPERRCIAPDLPNFGASRADGFDYAFERQGELVAALADALALDRFDLVVHDIGAAFGVAFATAHAARVRTMTIFNASIFPSHFWARTWQRPVLGELAMVATIRPLFVRSLRRGSPRMPRAYADAAFDAFGPRARRAVLRWYRAMRRELPGWDERFRAATAAIPKQVVWGELDPFSTRSTADRFGADVRLVADCGHWLMTEDPALAAAAIAARIA